MVNNVWEVLDICLVNNNRIIKKIIVPSKGKNIHTLEKHFKKFDFKTVKTDLISSLFTECLP